MSRIGKEPIALPTGVTIGINGTIVSVKGPKGNLTRTVHEKISVTQADGNIIVKPFGTEKPSEVSKEAKALWGLTRQLVNNMVTGVSSGYSKILEINGTGYRASIVDGMLQLSLGYSHDILFAIPKDVEITCAKNTITVSGVDKELVGQVSAEIRGKRKPEPYKGKGIKYSDEVIIKKAAKKK